MPRASTSLIEATGFLQAALADGRRSTALAGATPYLRLFALATGGGLLARGAMRAKAEDGEDGFVALARYFAETMVAETAALAMTVIEGAEALEAASAAWLDGRE